MSAAPRIIRTKNFVADAAAFILEQARKANAECVLVRDAQFSAVRVNPSAGEVTWMIGE